MKIDYQKERLHQTDYRFSDIENDDGKPVVNLYACFLFAIRAGVEDFIKEPFTPETNRDLILRAQDEDAINQNTALYKSDSHQHVLNIALDLAEQYDKVKGKYLGSFDSDNKAKEAIKDLSKVEYYFFIDEYDVKDANSHFMLAAEDGEIVYDPYPGLNLGDRVSRRTFALIPA